MNSEVAWIKEEDVWGSHKGIRFSAGGYEALIIPDVGANIVELKNTLHDISILRTPSKNLEFEAFKNKPQIYGLPVLFPPNRIEDGTFKLGEKEYKFPINEPQRNNYIHGFIKNDKWEITTKEIVNNEVHLEAEFNFDEMHEYFKYFSHKFQFKLSYTLSERGLEQSTSVTNLSDVEMPIGIGYHTAFNVPFYKESKDDNYRLITSADKRILQDERNLPTGEIVELNKEEKNYNKLGIEPLAHPMECHYSLKSINALGKNFKGAIIEDISKKLRVVYEFGDDYNYMVVWNDMADKHYVCIEPQTCMINAVNSRLDRSKTGFKTLLPKQKWSENCKIFAQEIK